jgi:hypothetical protein
MATFHPFLRLPYELRTCVWKLTVEPRTVRVDVQDYFLASATPVPAVLQVCREARNYGLYQKAFSELANRFRGLS